MPDPRLETLICNHITLKHFIVIMVHIILVTIAFFTAHVPFDGSMAIVSTLFTLVLFLPTAFVTVRWLGWTKGLLILFILGILAIVIEALAIQFGIPYGHFVYNAKTGIMVGSTVPLSTPFVWVPILLGSVGIVSGFRIRWLFKLVLTALVMVSIDLLVDPVAVTLGLWRWVEPGMYYGVPVVNYAGWIVSSLVGSCIFYVYVKKCANGAVPPVSLAISLYFSCILWLSLALFLELYVPFMLGIVLLLICRRQFSQAIREYVYA